MNFSELCVALGCPLANIRWSWSALSADGKRAVFTVWDDMLDAGRYPLWSPEDTHINDRPGAREIRRIAEKAAAGGVEALGIRCFAKDPDASPRIRQKFDAATLLVLRVVHESGSLVAYVAEHLPLKSGKLGRPVSVFWPKQEENGLDDLNQPPPGVDQPNRVSGQTTTFARDPKVRAYVLNRAKGKCEYCGEQGFAMSHDRYYLETHHVIALAKDGADTVHNVIALCAGHHREAHYGTKAEALETEMMEKLSRLSPRIA